MPTAAALKRRNQREKTERQTMHVYPQLIPQERPTLKPPFNKRIEPLTPSPEAGQSKGRTQHRDRFASQADLIDAVLVLKRPREIGGKLFERGAVLAKFRGFTSAASMLRGLQMKQFELRDGLFVLIPAKLVVSGFTFYRGEVVGQIEDVKTTVADVVDRIAWGQLAEHHCK